MIFDSYVLHVDVFDGFITTVSFQWFRFNGLVFDGYVFDGYVLDNYVLALSL